MLERPSPKHASPPEVRDGKRAADYRRTGEMRVPVRGNESRTVFAVGGRREEEG